MTKTKNVQDEPKAMPMDEDVKAEIMDAVPVPTKFDPIQSNSRIGKLIQKILPSIPHMVDLKDKLVDGEVIKDTARIRHYSEIQIVLGFLATVLGFFLIFTINGLFFILFIFGLYIMLTGYEIEDIAITSQRLILRRVGIWERLIKIPSEEEHLLDHVVSFTVGRAPFHLVLVTFSFVGFVGAIAIAGIPIISLILVAASLYLLIRGLRLGNRTVTVFFAGGHYSVLGLRKGVPEHAVSNLKKAVFKMT